MPIAWAPNGCSGAPEAADHFVVDEEHPVPTQYLLDLRVVAVGRDDYAGDAHHGLGDEGGDGLRTFGTDQVVEFVGEARGEVVLGLAFVGFPVVVRCAGVQHAGNRQVEVRMERGEAGEAAARHRDPVVAGPARDDLLAFRLADDVVVVPHELHLGVVGVGARQSEEHATGVERHHALELLRKQDARLMGLAGE